MKWANTFFSLLQADPDFDNEIVFEHLIDITNEVISVRRFNGQLPDFCQQLACYTNHTV